MLYYSVKEAAKILSITERWLQMLCKEQKIPGAIRLNQRGAWQIPQKWVNTQDNNNEKKKGEEQKNMNKVSFVYDDVSVTKAKDILLHLQNKGIALVAFGEIPILAHSDENTIIERLSTIIADSEVVVGVSSSGNGVAIYTNKIRGYTAAPITTIDDINVSINLYNANAFDISASNENVFELCDAIIERFANI